jgi:hypothetical protein
LREPRKFEIFETGGDELAIEAARNFRSLRQRACTVRKTIDRLIATFCSALLWRPELLQWEFLVRIGPDNQVGNVSFETRPPMWHAAGDDDDIALGEST